MWESKKEKPLARCFHKGLNLGRIYQKGESQRRQFDHLNRRLAWTPNIFENYESLF